MQRQALPPFLLLLISCATPAFAEESAAAVAGESATGAAEATTPADIGPLYAVTTGEDPTEDPSAAYVEVEGIYEQGDQTFLSVFWYWVLGIAGLSAVGAVAWFIWGRGQPKKASRL